MTDTTLIVDDDPLDQVLDTLERKFDHLKMIRDSLETFPLETKGWVLDFVHFVAQNGYHIYRKGYGFGNEDSSYFQNKNLCGLRISKPSATMDHANKIGKQVLRDIHDSLGAIYDSGIDPEVVENEIAIGYGSFQDLNEMVDIFS